MNYFYTKRKKVNNSAINANLCDIASELLKLNPDGVFAISSTFEEKGNDMLGDEIVSTPCIISTIPVKFLTIPSCFKLVGGEYLSTWCDEDPIVKIIHKKIVFRDAQIEGKKYKDHFMKIK